MKTILRIILFILGVLSLASLAVLFRISNPNIGFTMQAVLSIALILYAVFFCKIPKLIHKILAILCLIPLCFVLFLGIYGNVSNADYTEDVVVVLGAGIRGEAVSRPLARRLDAAFAYWQKNPDAYIIVCGGLGELAEITEAEAMARYLISLGMPEGQILLEDRSTSTYENLLFANQILHEYFPQGFRAVLVTSDFHIFRAVRTARHVGLDVSRIGADTAWYTIPVNYLREMAAIINFWLR